jgi:hypothetical protein
MKGMILWRICQTTKGRRKCTLFSSAPKPKHFIGSKPESRLNSNCNRRQCSDHQFIFCFRESIYAGSTADSSFYESYDPFEYMTAQAQRHEEINQDFQDEEEGRKGGGAKDEAVAAIPPTPKRNHVQKVCLRFKVLQSATRMKHPISRSV